jgi:site-specific recombinase XerD
MQSKNTFEEYLRAHKLRESTVKGHLQDLERFKKWSEEKSIHPDKASYNDLLSFVQEAQQRGVSNSSINIHLNSIGKYVDYLKEEGIRGDNPAKELRIKNSYKKVLQNLLSPEQLEQLYESYQNRPEWTFKGTWKELHHRNVIMLGLMIFQGTDTATLKKLETSHIHLSKGTVYIPSTSRGNSRVLKLHSLQILPIQHYLQQRSFSKETSEKLFDCKLTYAISWLMKTLKTSNSGFKNINQIRSSVIMNWLKIYNIRQVQYMAGHKHISSTERYKEEDLEILQQQVNRFHPLK